MSDNQRSRFDFSQIGEADRHNLASTFYDAIVRFYENPENLKRFEEWKAKKKTGI